jgi:hypothetical protein
MEAQESWGERRDWVVLVRHVYERGAELVVAIGLTGTKEAGK